MCVRKRCGVGMFIKRKTIFDRIQELETLFEDVETEGKKQGYERASREYEQAVCAIKKEYESMKYIFDNERLSKEARVDQLIDRLKILEEKHKELQKEISLQEKKFSQRFDVPIQEIQKSREIGSVVERRNMAVDMLDLACMYKSGKKRDAEKRGYQEAKEEYIKKISILKENLKRIKIKGEAEMNQLTSLIDEVWEEIIKEETRIAELKIALS